MLLHNIKMVHVCMYVCMFVCVCVHVCLSHGEGLCLHPSVNSDKSSFDNIPLLITTRCYLLNEDHDKDTMCKLRLLNTVAK